MTGSNVVPFVGRSKPYTERGIRRVPCSRCGKPSAHQWNICANGGRFLGCCDDCDAGLNRVAMEYMRVPNGEALMGRYETRKRPE